MKKNPCKLALSREAPRTLEISVLSAVVGRGQLGGGGPKAIDVRSLLFWTKSDGTIHTGGIIQYDNDLPIVQGGN